MALKLLFAPLAFADEFCGKAQQWIAQTDMQAKVVVYEDREAFVESKASIEPLTVPQFFSNPEDSAGIPKVVSCKMKTAEQINAVYGIDGAVAGSSQTCETVLSSMLETRFAQKGAHPAVLARGDFVIDDEDSTFIGPMWLDPWPFQPISVDQTGAVHLLSRSLYVPDAWYIPMPDSFKGVYYCHIISPVYLDALITGALPRPPQ
ncbi:MAG: hypothetical protein ABJK20_09410 [Halieaceae bacterium]